MMQPTAETTGSSSSTPHRAVMSSPRKYDVGQVLLSLMNASTSDGNAFAIADDSTDDADDDEAAPAPASRSRVLKDTSQQMTRCGLCGNEGVKLRPGNYGNVQVAWRNDHDTLTCEPCYRLVLSARKRPNDAKMLALFATPKRPAISDIENVRRYLERTTRKPSAGASYKVKSNRGEFNFKSNDRRSGGKNDEDTEEDTDCDDEYASEEDRDQDNESDHDRSNTEPRASSTVIFNSGAASVQPQSSSAFSTAKCGICRIEDPAQNELKQNRYPFPLALGVDWGIAKSAQDPLCKACYRMAFKVLSIKASTEPGRKISETHRARCLAFLTEVGDTVLQLSQRTDVSEVEALRENVNEFEGAGRDDTAHDKAARNRAATRLALNMLSVNSQKSSVSMPVLGTAAARSSNSKRNADAHAAMPLPPQAVSTRSFALSSSSASSSRSDEHSGSDAVDSNINREQSAKRQKQATQHELFSDSFSLHRGSSSQSHHDVDGEDDDGSSFIDNGNASGGAGGVDDFDIKSMPESNEQRGLHLALAPSQSTGVSELENCEIAMEIQDDDESISESERQFRRLARAQAIMLTEKAIIIEQQRLQIRNLLHLKEAAYATMYQLTFDDAHKAAAAAQHAQVISSTASRQSSSASSGRNSPPLSMSVPSFLSSPSSSEQDSNGAGDRRNELDGPVFIPSIGDIVFVNEPNQTQAFEVEITSVDEQAATASFKYCDRNYRHYGVQSCSLVHVFRNAPDRRTRRRTSTSTASLDDEADEA